MGVTVTVFDGHRSKQACRPYIESRTADARMMHDLDPADVASMAHFACFRVSCIRSRTLHATFRTDCPATPISMAAAIRQRSALVALVRSH